MSPRPVISFTKTGTPKKGNVIVLSAEDGGLSAAAKACDQGDGVVILTDMFGGTPSNLAISVMGGARIEVIAGVNLPMLIKLAEVRGKLPLAEAALAAQEAGRKYISVASALLQRAE